MRPTLTTIAATAAAALALTACSATDDAPEQPPAATVTGPPPSLAPPPETGPPAHGWERHPDVDFATGEVRADGFNDLVDSESPEWARDPVETVTVLLRLAEAEGTVATELASEGDEPVVVATVSDLPDNSVAAMRYRISLTAGDDGLHRFTAGEASWRCQPERGHQDFDTAPCT